MMCMRHASGVARRAVEWLRGCGPGCRQQPAAAVGAAAVWRSQALPVPCHALNLFQTSLSLLWAPFHANVVS